MNSLRIALNRISMWALSSGRECKENENGGYTNWYECYSFRRSSNGKLICIAK